MGFNRNFPHSLSSINDQEQVYFCTTKSPKITEKMFWENDALNRNQNADNKSSVFELKTHANGWSHDFDPHSICDLSIVFTDAKVQKCCGDQSWLKELHTEF
jgi:hypothetical protein